MREQPRAFAALLLIGSPGLNVCVPQALHCALEEGAVELGNGICDAHDGEWLPVNGARRLCQSAST